jgi:hypothetical protein
MGQSTFFTVGYERTPHHRASRGRNHAVMVVDDTQIEPERLARELCEDVERISRNPSARWSRLRAGRPKRGNNSPLPGLMFAVVSQDETDL